ncbi:PREDICTED: putative F-box protein At3g20030 [Camelina sativa]|uniref:F-box protein At3g20030 n=1 Tax=Camelina sativa TaxID=90675 RepID=A0ABM0XM47_CAMSA|nr:PREDICTED: putative F-box protein At3g20030 [Camelina sativa]
MTTMFSDLPKDLVEDILSRVPITYLGAMRSTCKRWNTLTKERILWKTEGRHPFMGFMMMQYKLCSLRFDLHGTFNKIELVDTFIKEIGNNLLNQVKVSKVFHCDGLLLCVTKEDNARLVVWNPYLGQTRWIQPLNAYHRADSYAIGYDNNRKHKILRFLNYYDRSVGQLILEYEIYDLSSNSWRVLDITTPTLEIEFYQGCASLKGDTYFFTKEKIVYDEAGDNYNPEPHDCLLCFDFKSESFGQLLPLPFVHYLYDVGGLSSVGDEKLAALSQPKRSSKVEIWVTTMIDPNAVSWNPFLKLDLGLFPHFNYLGGSFFIDEEKKVAVVIDFHTYGARIYEGAACIIGENMKYVRRKRLGLGEARSHIQGAVNFSEFACCSSYVPSLAQIN